MSKDRIEIQDRSRPEAPEKDVVTVYYDGSCPLCSWEINQYRSCQGGELLQLIDVSKKSAEVGPDLTTDKAMRRFHVRQADGSLLSGAEAFVRIWQVLPAWRWVSRITQYRYVVAMMEIGYRIILPLRPSIAKILRLAGVKAIDPQS